MSQVSSTILSDDQEYFKPISDVKCHHCGRFLLYDPRLPMTKEIGQLLRNFDDWKWENIKERIKFTGDELIWNCKIHGPCHEGCDYEYHEKHKISIQ